MFDKRKKQEVLALDLGTTKFCLGGLGPTNELKDNAFKAVSVNAYGMHKGMLFDKAKAKGSLLTLAGIWEEENKSDIREVIVGISGSHLASQIIEHKISFSTSKTIGYGEIIKAEEAIKEKCQDNKFCPIETIPLHYKVDDRHWSKNPLELTGNHLTARYLVVTANRNYLKDVVELVNSCGLMVSKFYSESSASSLVCVPKNAKLGGAIVCDIGGGTTDGIIYINDNPVCIFTINIGGVLFTQDLSIGLGVDTDQAEKLKSTLKMVPVQKDGVDFHFIVQERLKELVYILEKHIKPFTPYINSGIYLTGGGSKLKGIELSMSCLLKKDVHLATVSFDHIAPNLNHKQPGMSPKHATTMGLLALHMLNKPSQQHSTNLHFFRKFINPFTNWLQQLI